MRDPSLRVNIDRIVLVGVEVPPGSMNLEIKPYATSNLTSDVTATPPISNDVGGDVGLDMKYGVTQNLTADLTYNTDFAQVEAELQRQLQREGLPQGLAGGQVSRLHAPEMHLTEPQIDNSVAGGLAGSISHALRRGTGSPGRG